MMWLCTTSCHPPTLLCVPQIQPTITAQVGAGLPSPTQRAVNLCTDLQSLCRGECACATPRGSGSNQPLPSHQAVHRKRDTFLVARHSPMIEDIRSCAKENLSRSPALSLVSRD